LVIDAAAVGARISPAQLLLTPTLLASGKFQRMFSGGTPPRSIALRTPVNEPLALSILTLMSTVVVAGMPANTMPLIFSMADAVTLNTLSGLFCPANMTP
jgi:hypothetical protein